MTTIRYVLNFAHPPRPLPSRSIIDVLIDIYTLLRNTFLISNFLFFIFFLVVLSCTGISPTRCKAFWSVFESTEGCRRLPSKSSWPNIRGCCSVANATLLLSQWEYTLSWRGSSAWLKLARTALVCVWVCACVVVVLPESTSADSLLNICVCV